MPNLCLIFAAIRQNADKRVQHVEQELLMNNELVITMAAAKTEALVRAEKLVTTTSRRQTGTHNNQL
jgi:hypothetical protein